MPPSTNNLYVNFGRRRVRSEKYNGWLNSCQALFWVEKLTVMPPKTPYEVFISAKIPRSRDLDNLVKPTLDALVRSGFVPDDKYVDCVTIRRRPNNWGDLPLDEILVEWNAC